MKKVTLGMCVYDDFDGAYFSCQANRLMHPILDAQGEILIIDNNPSSSFGIATKKFAQSTEFIRYVPFTERTGTSVRNKIFDLAQGEVVICIDCHVLLVPGSIEALLTYFDAAPSEQPLLVQGPMVRDTLNTETRFWHDVWARGMHGSWSRNMPLAGSEAQPFEIDNMGLGAFAARRSQWLRFHDLFRSFGGEEGYIHRKYQKNGGRCICLPSFKWVHRFARPLGQPYPHAFRDRIFNYCIGCFELDEHVDRAFDYLSLHYPSWIVDEVFEEARASYLRHTGVA